MQNAMEARDTEMLVLTEVDLFKQKRRVLNVAKSRKSSSRAGFNIPPNTL